MRLFVLSVAAAFAATPALATPALVSSSPAANATVARTAQIRLGFDRALDLKRSRISVVMTAMPGMANHGEMRMTAVTTTLAEDGRTLVTTAKSPFPAGSYRLGYIAVATDRSVAKGEMSFTLD